MNDREVNFILRDVADSLGVCREFRDEWKDDFSRKDLIDFYKKGIEFCIEYNFPDIMFIKSNFKKNMLHENNIFVDEAFDEVKNGSGVYVCNGNSTGTLKFKGMDVATVYVRHTCNVNITAEGVSKVFIDVLDASSVNIRQIDNATVYVYQKGKRSKLNTYGDVMVRRKG